MVVIGDFRSRAGLREETRKPIRHAALASATKIALAALVIVVVMTGCVWLAVRFTPGCTAMHTPAVKIGPSEAPVCYSDGSSHQKT